MSCQKRKHGFRLPQKRKALSFTGSVFFYLRRAPRRRKLRIARLRASARARSRRCSAFPHATRLRWARAGAPHFALPSFSAGAPQEFVSRSTLFRQCACGGTLRRPSMQRASGARTLGHVVKRDNRQRKRKRSKETEQCVYGIPTLRDADLGGMAGERRSHHRRLSLYGSLKPFLSFRKRKERNGFKKTSPRQGKTCGLFHVKHTPRVLPRFICNTSLQILQSGEEPVGEVGLTYRAADDILSQSTGRWFLDFEASERLEIAAAVPYLSGIETGCCHNWFSSFVLLYLTYKG